MPKPGYQPPYGVFAAAIAGAPFFIDAADSSAQPDDAGLPAVDPVGRSVRSSLRTGSLISRGIAAIVAHAFAPRLDVR
jgi:hypothetical protein